MSDDRLQRMRDSLRSGNAQSMSDRASMFNAANGKYNSQYRPTAKFEDTERLSGKPMADKSEGYRQMLDARLAFEKKQNTGMPAKPPVDYNQENKMLEQKRKLLQGNKVTQNQDYGIRQEALARIMEGMR